VSFTERHVETDGVRIRCLEAGQGAPLVYVHGAGTLEITSAHDRLARRFRVIALESPADADACSTQSTSVLASTMLRAIQTLGVETFNLLGSSVGSPTALWMALQAPSRILALVLEGPDRDVDLERRLPDLASPTLVLVGTRQVSTAQEMGRACKERIPNCHLVFVYDAGSAIGRDRPEAFAEVVTDFVERREAFVISRGETVIHP
jgi:pimeloyl-ACP methyl ester carboxylesterase